MQLSGDGPVVYRKHAKVRLGLGLRVRCFEICVRSYGARVYVRGVFARAWVDASGHLRARALALVRASARADAGAPSRLSQLKFCNVGWQVVG